MKLNQIVAIVSGRKARAQKILTEGYRWVPEKLKGLIKTYQPLDDEGDKLPSESKAVPEKVVDIVKFIISRVNDYYDAVATQETWNQSAKADVKIDGEEIMKDVPVTVLLFLERQLVDLLTFAKSIPVLPSDKEWKKDDNKGCYITEPEETTRTTKQPKPVVLYPHSAEHPAQTQMFSEDKIVGHWSTIHMSGAAPQKYKSNVVRRIEQLQDAVKKAREEANSIEIGDEMSNIGSTMVEYIFGNLQDI